MDLPLLSSAILRQTTVFVARLSTLGGSRSPLARIAGEVFLGLVAELDRQGVGKKVAADMFGLALRSFQLKVQRVRESASERGTTLWSAVRNFVEQRGCVTRSEILERFARDDPASVRGILNDLVENGVVYRTGKGDSSMYRATPLEDFGRRCGASSTESDSALVWLVVCREGALTASECASLAGLSIERTQAALARLEAAERVQRTGEGDEPRFGSGRCLIPVGDEAGWEAAVMDHHQAVLNAIAAKMESGLGKSSESDTNGGSTYAFELWPGHPEEAAARELFACSRREAARVWDRVSAYNAQGGPRGRGAYRLTYYLGQYSRSESEEES